MPSGDEDDAQGAGAASRFTGVTTPADGGGGGRPPRTASAAPVDRRGRRGPAPLSRGACPRCCRMSVQGMWAAAAAAATSSMVALEGGGAGGAVGGGELSGMGTTRDGETVRGGEGGMGCMRSSSTKASWPEKVLKRRGRPPSPVGCSLTAPVGRIQLVKGSHRGLLSQCPRN